MRLSLPALAVAATALLVPPASASHSGYGGGCAITWQADSHPVTPNAVLTLAATANPTGTAISMTCYVVRNGVSLQYYAVVSATGIGAVANGALLLLPTAASDTVEVCESAVVDGHAVPVSCHP